MTSLTRYFPSYKASDAEISTYVAGTSDIPLLWLAYAITKVPDAGFEFMPSLPQLRAHVAKVFRGLERTGRGELPHDRAGQLPSDTGSALRRATQLYPGGPDELRVKLLAVQAKQRSLQAGKDRNATPIQDELGSVGEICPTGEQTAFDIYLETWTAGVHVPNSLDAVGMVGRRLAWMFAYHSLGRNPLGDGPGGDEYFKRSDFDRLDKCMSHHSHSDISDTKWWVEARELLHRSCFRCDPPPFEGKGE